MSECTHDCESCSANCESRGKESFQAKANAHSRVKKVIGVVSGKGGVGKSLISSLMAVEMRRRNYETAIMDADITGPSIPKAFGLRETLMGNDDGIVPARSKTGIKIVSINLMMENETDPVIWRGPIIAETVKQFWTEVMWEDVDFMFVDMPPGTGDVPLTVFQSLPIDGIIIVTSPQELVGMIVTKAVKMAEMMNVPVLGIVENMSGFVCPDCGSTHYFFGKSRVDKLAAEFGVDTTAKVPISIKLSAACDKGMIELFEGNWLKEIADKLEKMI